MDGVGNGKGFGSGCREEDARGRQHEQGNQILGGGNTNSGDRRPFLGRNIHLRFNLGGSGLWKLCTGVVEASSSGVPVLEISS
jgi:hypothetical protein